MCRLSLVSTRQPNLFAMICRVFDKGVHEIYLIRYFQLPCLVENRLSFATGAIFSSAEQWSSSLLGMSALSRCPVRSRSARCGCSWQRRHGAEQRTAARATAGTTPLVCWEGVRSANTSGSGSRHWLGSTDSRMRLGGGSPAPSNRWPPARWWPRRLASSPDFSNRKGGFQALDSAGDFTCRGEHGASRAPVADGAVRTGVATGGACSALTWSTGSHGPLFGLQTKIARAAVFGLRPVWSRRLT